MLFGYDDAYTKRTSTLALPIAFRIPVTLVRPTSDPPVASIFPGFPDFRVLAIFPRPTALGFAETHRPLGSHKLLSKRPPKLLSKRPPKPPFNLFSNPTPAIGLSSKAVPSEMRTETATPSFSTSGEFGTVGVLRARSFRDGLSQTLTSGCRSGRSWFGEPSRIGKWFSS